MPRPDASGLPAAGDILLPLWHHHLLGNRLQLFSWLRYLVALAMAAGSFFATYGVGVEGLHVGRLCVCAALLAAYNTVVFVTLRRDGVPQDGPGAYRRLVLLSHLTITADYLFLTYAIWEVGGTESPFLGFYLLHVMAASVLLSRRAACAHAAFGYLLLASLVLGECAGWLPLNRPRGAAPSEGAPDPRYVLTVLVVYGLLMAWATFLMTGLAQALRAGERELRRINDELARLSDTRRTFLRIALHDLKAPVGAVSMLLHNIASLGPVNAEQERTIERCHKRLEESVAFLRDMQVLAELETTQMTAQAQVLDLAPFLQEVVEAHRDLAQQRRQTLTCELPAGLPAVRGVPRLLREAVANYLTNALKYTPEGGTITVRTRAVPPGLRLEVTDNGPGLDPADQARLFQDFVRIAPKAPGGTPVAGTGLGLALVRRIAEAHSGRAGVVSAPGQGSTFFIELPA